MVKKTEETIDGTPVKDEATNRKEKNKYILVVANPFGGDWSHTRRMVEFPIDKPEPKILEDIKDYLRKNNHRRYELYRGRRIML